MKSLKSIGLKAFVIYGLAVELELEELESS